MFGRKLKWYFLFETKQELDKAFGGRDRFLHTSLFGSVLLIKSADSYFAFKPVCPHQNKPLSTCSIEEDHVVCPFHQYRFSLKTGRGHGMYLEQYPLRMDEKGVFLGKEGWSIF